MADKKISQLTALAAANLAPSTDVLAIVDTSATETKKIVAQDLINGVLNVASAVGIGTASPGYKLDVNGNAQVGNATAATNRFLYINGVANKAGAVAFQESGVNRWLIGNGAASENGNFEIYDATNGNNFILTRTGNLGLGVTPSAWSGVGGVFEIKGNAYIYSATGVLSSGANAFFNGTNWIYKTTQAATRYEQVNGQHQWSYAASGTAGNAITFTQAMTLHASGGLSVGSTTDPGAGAATISGTSTNSQLAVTATGVANTTIGFNASGSTTQGITNNTAYVSVRQSYPLAFGTAETERGRFTAGGYFKASNDGTYDNSTGAYHEFKVTNSVRNTYFTSSNASPFGPFIQYSGAAPNGTGNEFLYCTDNAGGGTIRATIRSNGGLANYSANDVNLSDERVKTDIAPLDSMWDKFKAIEIVTFKYKDQTHEDNNIGVIAQQVESVAPEFVDADGWGETPDDGVPLKSIYTADMYHAAIKALQEAMARIESLEAKVSALEAK